MIMQSLNHPIIPKMLKLSNLRNIRFTSYLWSNDFNKGGVEVEQSKVEAVLIPTEDD